MAAVVRDPDEEREAEAVAFGLFVLQAPIGLDHAARFRMLGHQERELLLAKARFIRAYAADHLMLSAAVDQAVDFDGYRPRPDGD